MRPNKLKLWSFEQKKVYCKALLGDKVACTLKSQVGGGREVQKRGMYVYLWLIHVDVWQNLTVLLSNYPSIKNKYIKKKKAWSSPKGFGKALLKAGEDTCFRKCIFFT